jgi:hypothetical protein
MFLLLRKIGLQAEAYIAKYYNIIEKKRKYPHWLKIYDFSLSKMNFFLKVTRAGEQTGDLLISFIFSFHHSTAEPQRLPQQNELTFIMYVSHMYICICRHW